MSETYELAAERRERVGKGAARAVRRQGRIPAVIYGGGESPLPITLSHKEIDLQIKSGGFLSTVATLKVDGKSVRVIPKDYQLDPVRDFPLHVDFFRVSRDSVLTVDVPVHFAGEEESIGLKRGGVLNIVRHTVEVTAPADQIPDFLTANIADLDINDAVKISNVELPANVTPTITDRDFTIATVAAPAGFGEDLDAPVEEGETELIDEEGETVEGAATEGEGESGESEDKE